MTKKSIKNFFVAFLLFYFGTILISFAFVKTNIDSAKSHTTKSFETKNYIAQVTNNNNFMASLIGRDRVKAAEGNIFQEWVIKPIMGYTVSAVADNLGFSNTSIVSIIESAVQEPLTGCKTVKETSEAAQAISAGTDASTTCLAGGAMYAADSNILLPEDSESTGFNKINPNARASILGLATTVTYNSISQVDTLVNLNLYANDTIRQVPIFGNNIARAQSPTPYMNWALNTVALGDNFFILWTYARNISYILIIIPAIALGFAIMFRVQLGNQTQITLLQSIPNFLVILLLITFSYPIAGIIVNFAKPIVDIAVSLVWEIANSLNQNSGGAGSGGLILIGVTWILVAITGLFLNPVGIVALVVLCIFLIFLLAVLIRYGISVFMQAFRLSFVIALGPLILLTAAFPGRFDTVKNYFLNVVAGVMGISASVILFSIFFAIILIGSSINFIVGIAGFFFACGLLWKSPSIHKQIAAAMGAKPLFELGGGDPKRR